MNTDPIAIAVQVGQIAEPAHKQINYGFSLQDISRFENAYNDAVSKSSLHTDVASKLKDTEVLQKILSPLTSLNQHSDQLKFEATSMIGDDIKPGQMLMLTMRVHEFMFHAELTANVANRSSDGVQQLFRQQS